MAGTDGHPSGRQLKKKNNPNWEHFLSEGCFNITKMPNVSKALGGDIRMEKQDIGYDKQENKELILNKE